MKKTTVTVDENTKGKLATFGAKGESFDIILQRVMKNADTFCAREKNDDKVQEE